MLYGSSIFSPYILSLLSRTKDLHTIKLKGALNTTTIHKLKTSLTGLWKNSSIAQTVSVEVVGVTETASIEER